MSDRGHRMWHTLECATVEQLTRSSTVDGITSEDASSRQTMLGRNELPSGTSESWWKRLGLYMYELSQGSTIEHARTVAATAFVVVQMLYLVACRSHTRPGHHGLLRQPVLWVSMAGMLVLRAVFVYAPFAQQFFGTAAIDARSWLVVVLLGVLLYAGVEFEKYARVRRTRRAHR